MNPVLRRYQIMSWIVGTALLVLTAAALLDWVGGKPAMARVVSPIHGVLYMLYLLTVAEVAYRFKPGGRRIAAMVISGFIPLLAFFVEHRTIQALAISPAA